jgi:hypothetical protein
VYTRLVRLFYTNLEVVEDDDRRSLLEDILSLLIPKSSVSS